MKNSESNWQERAQEAIYEAIKGMSAADELDYWQQETARMRSRQRSMQNDPDHMQRLTALLTSNPQFKSSR